MTINLSSFVPYGRQTISEADIKSVVDVLRSPFLTQGPVVPQFEEHVASKVCAEFGVAVNSATSALHIACLSLGLGVGDRLWTTPITFVASANCGRYCGADVDFVDIDPVTGLMSVPALAEKLSRAEQAGTLPKIVIPVHLTGSSCNMEAISALADQYGFSIIEDASHAIGGFYNGFPVGSCVHSAITVFSFHPVKIITTGEGGLATTNDPLLAQRMSELRSHGITKDEESFIFTPDGPWSYEQQNLGFNYRMTDFQAALGLSQLNRIDEFVQDRNAQLNNYRHLISDLPIHLLEVPKNVTSSVHLAVIRLHEVTADKHRFVFEGMRGEGIGVQLHYTPVHLQPYYRSLGFANGQFPESEAYAKSSISLPIFPGLSADIQKKVIDILASFL